jgi:hypothetical protein
MRGCSTHEAIRHPGSNTFEAAHPEAALRIDKQHRGAAVDLGDEGENDCGLSTERGHDGEPTAELAFDQSSQQRGPIEVGILFF